MVVPCCGMRGGRGGEALMCLLVKPPKSVGPIHKRCCTCDRFGERTPGTLLSLSDIFLLIGQVQGSRLVENAGPKGAKRGSGSSDLGPHGLDFTYLYGALQFYPLAPVLQQTGTGAGQHSGEAVTFVDTTSHSSIIPGHLHNHSSTTLLISL